MADDFSKRFPTWIAGRPWPQTFEGKNRTYVGGFGSLRGYQPNSREQMIDFINRNFYDDSREGNKYAERIANVLDWSPVGLGHGIYDTTRATAEGRLGDAALAAGLTSLPGPDGPARAAVKKVRKGLEDVIEGPAKELGQTIAKNNIGQTLGDGSNTIKKITTGADPSDSMKPRNKQPRVPLHDPPTTPQRPFEEDYPKTPAHDETGRLLEDIDGDPITAQYVAGRQTLGGNDGGFNAKTFREIAKKLTEIQTVPQKNLGNSLGQMVSGAGPTDIRAIRLARELPERHMDRTLAHELGHGLHKKAGLPPIIHPVMGAELERNYSRLRTGIENPEKLTLPRDVHSNYHDPVVSDRELVADGYYAALAYPNYAKKALPVAYATMREWIKSNPELAKLVINNSVAAATVAAALAAAGERNEANAKASPPLTPQRNLPGSQGSLPGAFIPFGPFGLSGEATKAGAFGLTELAKVLYRRGLPPQAPKNEKFKDLVQALVDLKARQKSQLYGGPR